MTVQPGLFDLDVRYALSNAPLSVKASKMTIDEVLRDPAARDMEAIEQIAKTCFNSQDYTEGRQAFIEKRKPHFNGR